MSAPIVAIDGPAGAGKSTVARQLARKLGFTMIDTGAIYRSVALAARRSGVAWDDDDGLRKLLDDGLGLAFRDDRVVLHGQDVTEAIRTPEISRGASVVSARPVVREKLLGLQRELGRNATRGAVLEGRDIGTVVFPDAELKFFITASPEARADRRWAELAAKGLPVGIAEVRNDQHLRDKEDSERAIAPLKRAPDAIEIDTTRLALDEVVEVCHREALARLKHLISGSP
ncbi:MAG TPA: (d)CMP kinase [Longimicrobium sp.]|nr:(d)CMP kinase [Longimicrobium sp.]